jgi:hypothetical protein
MKLSNWRRRGVRCQSGVSCSLDGCIRLAALATGHANGDWMSYPMHCRVRVNAISDVTSACNSMHCSVRVGAKAKEWVVGPTVVFLIYIDKKYGSLYRVDI